MDKYYKVKIWIEGTNNDLREIYLGDNYVFSTFEEAKGCLEDKRKSPFFTKGFIEKIENIYERVRVF